MPPAALPSAARVLVVDDEENISYLVASALRLAGLEVRTAGTAMEALADAAAYPPDAVVLDVMLPDLDGFETLKRLRGRGIDAPVLFLSARSETADRVRGLTSGGDDYIVKPFALEEVTARVQLALARRGAARPESHRLAVADLVLDEDAHQVWRGATEVHLTATEFTLLRYFVINAGTVLSKPKILDHVWRYDFGGDVNVVESYVSYLRRKIDTGEKRLLHTLRGVGYVLREPR